MKHKSRARKRFASQSALSPRRNYKDRLFCRLFSEKDAALSLFNAANETHYTNADQLQITTLEDSLYLGLKNDLAICFHDSISLFEQQSSVNPNLPLRGLLYFARQYQNWLVSHDADLHSTKLIRLPAPRYYVLYNGLQTQPRKTIHRLSDSFLLETEGFEWTAQLLNINAEKAHPILKDCPLLRDYSFFVREVRKAEQSLGKQAKASGETLSKALETAIDSCIAQDILKPYLTKHKAEVTQMILTEFNQELHERILRKEGFEDGFENGFKQGQSDLLSAFLQHNSSLSNAATMLNLSPELVKETAETAGITLTE